MFNPFWVETKYKANLYVTQCEKYFFMHILVNNISEDKFCQKLEKELELAH